MVKASDLYIFLSFCAESWSNENIMKVSLFSSSLGGHRFSQHCSAVFSPQYFSGRGAESDWFMPSVSLRAPALSDPNTPFKSRFAGTPNGIVLLWVNFSHLVFATLLYQAHNVVTGKKCSENLHKDMLCLGCFPPDYLLGEIKCCRFFLKPASLQLKMPALVGFFPTKMNTGKCSKCWETGPASWR